MKNLLKRIELQGLEAVLKGLEVNSKTTAIADFLQDEGFEVSICKVCGRLEATENTEIAGWQNSEEVICTDCLYNSSEYIYCRGCGEETNGCLKPETELVSVLTKIGYKNYEFDYICKETSSCWEICETCGTFYRGESFENSICQNCAEDQN